MTAQGQRNIKLAESLGLDIQWDSLVPKPNATVDVDFTDAELVPAFLYRKDGTGAYKTTRGLGKRIKKETDGKLMVRTNPEDGRVYLVPVPESDATSTE